MKHRHLTEKAGYSVAAVADILGRGGEEDWRALARVVRSDPYGPVAQAVEKALDAWERYGEEFESYGTRVIWRRFLHRLRAGQENGSSA